MLKEESASALRQDSVQVTKGEGVDAQSTLETSIDLTYIKALAFFKSVTGFDGQQFWTALSFMSIIGSMGEFILLRRMDETSEREDYDELWLMSLRQHPILENSGLCWWGARLSYFPDKIVCRPDRWLLDAHVDISEVMPPNWHRIKV